MVLKLLLLLFLAVSAQAQLRLDCSDLTPKQLKMLKTQPSEDPCLHQGTSLVAITHTGVLYMCLNGVTQESFDISIGRGGIGKTKTGDLKTPLGTYVLGRSKASERFGRFIPVGYPTKAQKANGLTGADVGIHGPDRLFACAGALNVSVNWTQGCLAVADDRFLLEITRFVDAHRPINVTILE